MKKVLSIVVSLVLVCALLAACSAPAAEASSEAPAASESASVEETASELAEEPTEAPAAGTDAAGDKVTANGRPVKAPEDTKVVLATFTTEGDYWTVMGDTLGEYFTDGGYQFEVVSADGDPVKQIEQIENATAAGADLIITIALVPDAVTDACQAAMDQGVLICNFIRDTVARNAFRGTDEVNVATAMINLADKWFTETFPDAEDGSINAIVIGNEDSESEALRFAKMQEFLGADPRVTILDAVTVETSTTAAQTLVENLLQKYPDVNFFFVGSGDQSIGVNNYIMSEGSPLKDYEHIGIVGSEVTEEIANMLRQGVDNESVYRGSAVNGGNIRDNLMAIYENCVKMLSGDEFEEVFPVEVSEVTAENLGEVGY